MAYSWGPPSSLVDWTPLDSLERTSFATAAPGPASTPVELPRGILDIYEQHGLKAPTQAGDPSYVQAVLNQPRDPHSESMVQNFGPARPKGVPGKPQLSFDQLLQKAAAGENINLSNAGLNRLTRSQRSLLNKVRYGSGPGDLSNYAPESSIATNARIDDWAARGAPEDELESLRQAASIAGIAGHRVEGPNLYIAERAGLVPNLRKQNVDYFKTPQYTQGIEGMQAPAGVATSPHFVNMTPVGRDAEGRPLFANPAGIIPGSEAYSGAGASFGVTGIPDQRLALDDQLWAKRREHAPNAQQEWLKYIQSSSLLGGADKDLFDVGQSGPLTSWSFDPLSNPAAFIKRLELFGYGGPGTQYGLDAALSKAINIDERTGEITFDPTKLPAATEGPIGKGGDPLPLKEQGWARAAREAGIDGPVTLGFLPENRRLSSDFWAQYDAAAQGHDALQQRFEDYYAGNMSLADMRTFTQDVNRWRGQDEVPYNVPRSIGAQRPVGQGAPTYDLYDTSQSRLMQAVNSGKELTKTQRDELIGGAPLWEEKPWLRPFFATFGNFGIAQMAQERRSPDAIDHPVLGRVSAGLANRFEQWLRAGGGPFEKLKGASWQDADALGYSALGEARRVGARGVEDVVQYKEPFGPYPARGSYPSSVVGPQGINLPPLTSFDPRQPFAAGGLVRPSERSLQRGTPLEELAYPDWHGNLPKGVLNDRWMPRLGEKFAPGTLDKGGLEALDLEEPALRNDSGERFFDQEQDMQRLARLAALPPQEWTDDDKHFMWGMAQNMGITIEELLRSVAGLGQEEPSEVGAGLGFGGGGGGGFAGGGYVRHYLGGGQVSGPGTETSDSIPATIDGQQPAALSTNEFVLPAWFVRKLGEGSPEKGAETLYSLLRKAATPSGQGALPRKAAEGGLDALLRQGAYNQKLAQMKGSLDQLRGPA